MFGIGVFVTVWSVYHFVTRVIKNKANRKVLESGLLSIHSCGILWQAIVVAHYRALDSIRKDKGRKTYRKYTNCLSKETASLCENIFDIHFWIEGKKIQKLLPLL